MFCDDHDGGPFDVGHRDPVRHQTSTDPEYSTPQKGARQRLRDEIRL